MFPEGTISRTGHLAEFRSGYEKACAACSQPIAIVPFYLRGLWGSQFSRASDKLKIMRSAGLTREIIVAFGEPLESSTTADVLKRRVFDLSIVSWDEYVRSLPTIPVAWIATAKRLGSDMALADTLTEPLSGIRAITGAIVFSRRIRKLNRGANVGLLVPTSIGGVLANMATLLAGKTIVNLNYTASQDALLAALQQADLHCIFTSKQFMLRLQQRGVDLSRVLARVEVHYLEDIKQAVSRPELVATLVAVKFMPTRLLQGCFCKQVPAGDTAAILFSSGSEGAPKGVMLSHTNIMANLKQIADVLSLRDDDVVMAELPLFHAFGMTVGQFMPLIEGLPVVCHADPTDAMGVAKAVARYRATLFAATSTLLRLYIRNPKIHPLMLDSLRLVIAGAEKLGGDVRDAFKLKFNKDVYEGYGATETSPVASVNLPDQLDTNWWQVQRGSKLGTVGMPLPGSSFKIVDPESLEELATGEAGLILLGGCQVMKGYLNEPEKTAAVIVEDKSVRWYKTGDKGYIDKDGFLTIVDRYSRFAKLAGEMISLGAVEETIRNTLADPEMDIAAINLPDAKKGERIVLLYAGELESEQLRQRMLAGKMLPLMLPAQIVQVPEIPKLGSGKTDFVAARALAHTVTSDA
jgi:acyl-[acyl-carrier-protein]-phospholipid O-acyltransferase/long-chain-fatty-acid--[acyl-carrier-protein] ligase